MQTQSLDIYLEKINALAESVTSDADLKPILALIEEYQKTAQGNPSEEAFYRGEAAFFNKQYELALKYYLQARETPRFQFFCYRASAYVSFQRNDREKALSFLEKAIALCPTDIPTLNLKEELGHFRQTGTQENTFLDLLDLPAHDDPLSHSIKRFQEWHSQRIANYIASAKKQLREGANILLILQGWDERKFQEEGGIGTFLMEYQEKASGGFFFRWNGKGIAVNPGPAFLENFHNEGLHIQEIDCVIVTRNDPAAHTDARAIYALNYEINKHSPDLHVIHYYLNPKVYRELSTYLKPNFKQERNTVHCLELFLDSPDVEKVEIAPGILLNYFPTTTTAYSLGVRFDLKDPSQRQGLTIGYLSDTPWSPLLSHHMGHCDVLLAGFGNTQPQDYHKVKRNEDSLGFYGTASLLEEIHPRLMICTEFGAQAGDVRFECVKKLKEASQAGISFVLPGECGLLVDLKELHIQCSLSRTLTPPEEILVVKSASQFGKLNYLSPRCSL